MEVSGQRHDPVALYSWEWTLGTVGLEAVWASELVWKQWIRKNYFASAGDRTLVVQLVAKRYTN
jgi:hypothetical protein